MITRREEDVAATSPPNVSKTLEAIVRAIRLEAKDIISLELVSAKGDALPSFGSGSHIDVHLPNGVTRCYSLMNSELDRTHYRIGVLREDRGAGASRYIHDELRVGQVLTIGVPRNNFPVEPSAEHSVVFAGGIGATPFRSMLETLSHASRPWTMHYSARTRDRAAFLSEFEVLAGAGFGELHLHVGGAGGTSRLNIARIVTASPAGTHFYCCGPTSMMEAFKSACLGLLDRFVHYEFFAAEREPEKRGGFFVALARSGCRVEVPAGKTILDTLTGRGISVPSSCLQGICGTCETKVLGGTPDHRDVILSEQEKARNDTMMICCSGALSDELVLDL